MSLPVKSVNPGEDEMCLDHLKFSKTLAGTVKLPGTINDVTKTRQRNVLSE